MDPAGGRRFVVLDRPVALELGGTLPAVTVAYETWGRPRRDAAGRITNAVLVAHALSGDSHAAGPAGPGHSTAGWWDALIGPGRPIDTDRFHVVCPNVLGGCQGTTGPATAAPDGAPWGSRWPEITIADQVRVEAAFGADLGIARWAAVIGGSMGGMRALEWAIAFPDRVERAVVIACGATATADQLGLYAAQLDAITLDPGWRGGDYHQAAPGDGPHAGLGLARRLGQLSYRSEAELAARFANRVQPDGRFAVASYLDHHAVKLARRFDAGSYLTLTRAMMTQDVGRGRGGAAAALAGCPVALTVAGVDSDRLYPLYLQRQLAGWAGAAGPTVIRSPYGHDGFLLENDQIGAVVAAALDGQAPQVVCNA
ncbi:homoserine O-acetyltransferase [Frankia sp. AgW1.1]|uniref:homoserine O-acetyltransferase MetX n=1 Tax=Frankia sp. AgW1.1 TaxID=1836971 RepID=UPI00193494D0|nr:homoserine O-acetyltransferase [Frankia sp. AgW1.1]MBL7493032.1 homoserine O-acetyltransferase [Frankia sp. AgW1.1]